MDIAKFSERLNIIIFDKGLKPVSLANTFNISPSTLSNYLNNVQTPEFNILIKIADYFQISLDYLLGITDNEVFATFKPTPNFSQRFAEILKFYDTTEYYVNKASGISRSLLYRWLKGTKTPSATSLVRLARHFDCTIDFLVGRE